MVPPPSPSATRDPRPATREICRFLAAMALARIRIGGLAFYGGAVLPRLHKTFGIARSAEITRQATDVLNAIGVAAVAMGWVVAALERGGDSSRRWRMRLGLLATTTGLLLALVVLHRIMDGRLDTGRRGNFSGLHRVYLIVSTVQWFANLGLLALATTTRRNSHAEMTPDL